MTALTPELPHLTAAPLRAEPTAYAGTMPSFETIYEEHFDFIWRSLRRLGVAASSLDDAVQDVFIVVHRRLAEFEGRSSMKTWLFGIALRIAQEHRRRFRRKEGGLEPLEEAVVDNAPSPLEEAEKSEAVRALDRLLAALDDDKRAVFILAELEQMTAPEIAESLGINANTVYSRLRAARHDFDAALARRQHANRGPR